MNKKDGAVGVVAVVIIVAAGVVVAKTFKTMNPPVPPQSAPRSASGGGGGGGGMGAQKTPAQRLDDLAKAIGLTDAEKAKVGAIQESYAPKLKAIRDDKSLTRETRGPKMKPLRDAETAEIKAVLTPAEQTKYDDYIAKQRARFGGGGGRRGGGGPGAGGPGSGGPGRGPGGPGGGIPGSSGARTYKLNNGYTATITAAVPGRGFQTVEGATK